MSKKTRTFALEDTTFADINKISNMLGVSRSWLCEKVLKGYADKFLEEHMKCEGRGEELNVTEEITKLSGLFL